MNVTAKKVLRKTLFAALIAIFIAALLALIFLAVGQIWPEAGLVRIQWGEHATTLSTVFSSGVLEFFLAWGAVTLGILIAVIGIAFAALVTLLALGFTAFALIFSAAVVGFPLIVVALIVWFALRNNRHHDQAVPNRNAVRTVQSGQ
jgi:hypothetical protein